MNDVEQIRVKILINYFKTLGMSDGFRAKILNLLYQIKLAIRAIQKGGFYI